MNEHARLAIGCAGISLVSLAMYGFLMMRRRGLYVGHGLPPRPPEARRLFWFTMACLVMACLLCLVGSVLVGWHAAAWKIWLEFVTGAAWFITAGYFWRRQMKLNDPDHTARGTQEATK